MCTVSVIPLPGGGVRVACNRDEQRSRTPALPPQVRRCGNAQVLMPIDALSDGTWIAVSDRGVAMALLNVNSNGQSCSTRTRDGTPALQSRGHIIPMLLEEAGVDAALRAALALPARRFAPFRLVLATVHGCVGVVSDGMRVCIGSVALPGRPVMFTSSGLGDALVEPPRRKLFETLLNEGSGTVEQQDLFHRHYWPDQPHLSVRMSRLDARTVSRTVIELRADQAMLRYAPLDDDGDDIGLNEPHVLTLVTRQPVPETKDAT